MRIKELIYIAAILLLSFWAVKSLFIPGMFPIHDDTQVSRVYEMSRSLSDGMFPVRWVQDLGYGYGYPIFNFYAPLAYYFGGILVVLGTDPLLSTKVAFGTGILLAGIFMYLLGKSLWGNLGGVVSSVLYVYAPYSALNIYVRGDLAEVWGYAFVPLFFLGIINIYKNLDVRYIFVGSLGLAGIILSHNLTAYMTTIIFIHTIIFFTILSKNRIRFLKYSFMSFGLGLSLSAFYFIPALFEMQYTNVLSQVGGGADFRNHFICLSQLWESNWGYGGSTQGCLDGMSFRIGKLHLLIVLASLFVLLTKNNKLEKKFIIFLGLSLLISIYLTLTFSKLIWEITPLMEFLQYPWRFLIFVSFAVSLMGGGSVILTRLLPQNVFKHAAWEYMVLISFLSVFLYSKLFIPQTILPKTSQDYTEKSVLNYKISKISDEYMPKDFQKPENINEIPKAVLSVQKGEVELVEKKTQRIKAKLNAPSDSIIHANIAYFPAWKALVNGKEADIFVKNNGFEFKAPRGDSEIDLVFSQTSIEKFSNALSLLALVVLFAGIIRRKKL